MHCNPPLLSDYYNPFSVSNLRFFDSARSTQYCVHAFFLFSIYDRARNGHASVHLAFWRPDGNHEHTEFLSGTPPGTSTTPRQLVRIQRTVVPGKNAIQGPNLSIDPLCSSPFKKAVNEDGMRTMEKKQRAATISNSNDTLHAPQNGHPHSSKGDGEGTLGAWKVGLAIILMYVALLLSTQRAFVSVPNPAPLDAPDGVFSEGRALETTSYLADVIGHRQLGTVGEAKAAAYLVDRAHQLAALASKTRPDLDVTVATERVKGAFGRQLAFRYEIANAYNGLTNIVLRIAPKTSSKRALLINAHYDSTLGSPGASDAASCVGVALEIARVLISNASLPLGAPVVFLFNGGEETLMQASHGFMAQSRFAEELGAFINLESTGPWGPDVLFQHTGDWTLRAYARSAPFPRGNTLVQDFFELGLIPADTDYRMFSYRNYGSIPGIDVAFLFDGTAYHTVRDESSRIRPGTLQAMGENMLATALEFIRVLSTDKITVVPDPNAARGHAYFDILGTFMIVYGHTTAMVLHSTPLVLILLLSLTTARFGFPSLPTLTKAAGRALQAALFALIAPAFVAFVYVSLFRRPLSWYGATPLAYSIYLPASLAGFFFKATILPNHPHLRDQGTKSSKSIGSGHKWMIGSMSNSVHVDGSSHSQRLTGAMNASLGSGLAYAIISTIMTLSGLHSSYLLACWAAGSVVAAILVHAVHAVTGRTRSPSGWQVAGVVCASFALPLLISLPTATSITDHIVEKIGIFGSAPGPLGFVVPDVVVGIVTGASVVLAAGTLWPYFLLFAHDSFLTRAETKVTKLNQKSIAKFMLASSLITAATLGICDKLSGRSHPYSRQHPKRVIFMHTHHHSADGTIQESTYDFASLDAIPVDVALPPWILSLALPETNTTSRKDDNWVALYPLNYLVTSSSRVAMPVTMDQSDLSEPLVPTLRMINSRPAMDEEQRHAVSAWKWLLDLVAGSDQTKNDTHAYSYEDAEINGATSMSLPPVSPGSKRIHLELDTIQSAWAVLNISGDVRAWSLGPEVATASDGSLHAGSKYHIVRYASGYGTTRWRFWVDVARDTSLHIELFVKHLQETQEIRSIMESLQPWVSAAGVTMWRSSWEFE